MKNLLSAISFVVLMICGVSTVWAVEAAPAEKTTKAETKTTIKAETAVPKNVVNINTADVQELTRLKGIGEKKAEAIIAWRKENGNFKTVEDLLEVKGIGEATLESNRANISI
ncbi:ComEA family DNA-binding protein [Cellvibrio mixtus]|uniref:ComEA family DNA-binding protein n=1 Tax=Cellvibrio mixtus TaxID=39650 RepID=UPI000586D39F|nr:ComEA family DNA-binding protein [Cellvibrio mixtus]